MTGFSFLNIISETPALPATQTCSLIALIILLPLLGAIILGGITLKTANAEQGLSEKTLAILGCAGPALSGILSLFLLIALPRNAIFHQTLAPWISTPHLKIDFAFLFDPLSAILVLMITFIGTLIHVFSSSYMQGDRSYARYYAYLNLFMAAMLMLILSDNLIGMFMGWEGVGVCSYLLIGFWFNDAEKASAGTKAFLVNRIGDFGFLLGIFFSFYYLGHFNYHQMQIQNISPEAATIIAGCLLIGALGKSAQIPLHVWLPDAMAGPTPVSALIHAATMVTAGVYMIARLHFIYSLSPSISWLIIAIGAATALMAATIAMVQEDIKKVLAYSTVSQLGYMFMAVGAGAYTAGVFHLFTHAFFKAALFLGAGAIIHSLHHEQNLAKMGGLKNKLKTTRWVILTATLAIAGIPPFAGFFSKDEILWSLWTGQHYVFWGVGLLTAGLTSFYMFRLYYLAFEGNYRGEAEIQAEPMSMKIPLVLLAVGAAFTGLLGLPDVLSLPNWFSHWLHFILPAEHHSGSAGLALTLMGVSVAAAAVGWFMAKQKFAQIDTLAPLPENTITRVLDAKYGFDYFYNTYLVQPLLRLGGFLWHIVDELLFDGPIKVIPKAYMIVSLCVRTLQMGKLRAYGYYMIIGLVMLVYVYYILHPGALFLS